MRPVVINPTETYLKNVQGWKTSYPQECAETIRESGIPGFSNRESRIIGNYRTRKYAIMGSCTVQETGDLWLRSNFLVLSRAH